MKRGLVLVNIVFLILFMSVFVSAITITGKVSASPTTTLSSCQDISLVSGKYILTQDVFVTSGSSQSCFSISDASNIEIDCQGHEISKSLTSNYPEILHIENSTNIMLHNCVLKNRGNGGNILEARDSDNITLENMGVDADSSIYASAGDQSLFFYNSSDIEITQNNFNTPVEFNIADRVVVTYNNFVLQPTRILGTLVSLDNGEDNFVSNNIFDGDYYSNDCSYNVTNKIDHAIGLANQIRAKVQYNNISNAGLSGMEIIGNLFDSIIDSNNITNTFLFGIGGAWDISVKNTTFSNNRIVDAYHPIGFYYEDTHLIYNQSILPGSINQVFYFSDNTFENNIFRQAGGNSCTPSNIIIGPFVIPPDEVSLKQFQISPSVFQNNQFIGNVGMSCTEADLFIDGGGNDCTQEGISTGISSQCNILCSQSNKTNTTTPSTTTPLLNNSVTGTTPNSTQITNNNLPTTTNGTFIYYIDPPIGTFVKQPSSIESIIESIINWFKNLFGY
jgi:hypothetical protein